MKVTVTDLKCNLKKIFDVVNRGEEVIITFRGKSCAKLVPYKEKSDKINKNELFGMWKDNKKIKAVHRYVKEVRNKRYYCIESKP